MKDLRIVLVGSTDKPLIQVYLGTVVFRYYDEDDYCPHLICSTNTSGERGTQSNPTNSKSFGGKSSYYEIRFRCGVNLYLC